MTTENGHDTMAAAMRSAGIEPVQSLDSMTLARNLDRTTELEIENAALSRRAEILQAEVNRLRMKLGVHGAMDALLEEVAEKYDTTALVLKGESLRHILAPARGEFWWRAIHELGKGPTEASRFLGGRDHSCAINGAKKYAERLAKQARIDRGEVQ